MTQTSVSGGSRGRFGVRVRAFCPPGSVLACCDAFDVALALHVVRHAIRRRESFVWVCDFAGERAGSAAQCSGEGAGEGPLRHFLVRMEGNNQMTAVSNCLSNYFYSL